MRCVRLPNLFLSEGKLGGLLQLAYEKGVQHGEEGVKLNPVSEGEAAFFVRDEVARGEQVILFHSWVQSQLREIMRLNRAVEGAMIATEKQHTRSRGLRHVVRG